MPEPRRGLLSVVATPIGNLEDITLRGLEVLRQADVVLAEDTRRTRKLLAHYAIKTKLRPLHAHSASSVVERALQQLEQGARLALVSDAGTPLISDPGGQLLREAAARGLRIESVPGPSAVPAALAVSGLSFDSFRFAGFAPRSGGRRAQWLAQIANSPEASVFFEAPNRLARTLSELSERMPDGRRLAVCRELTKLHEEVVRGSAAELAARFANDVRGEITVVVEAHAVADAAPDEAALHEAIVERLASGDSPRDVARALAEEHGLARREAYARVQRVVDTPDPD